MLKFDILKYFDFVKKSDLMIKILKKAFQITERL